MRPTGPGRPRGHPTADGESAPPAVERTLREALRDLIPDYRAPADPLVRVTASVRRRRTRRRVLLLAGAAAGVTAIGGAAPALVHLTRPATGHGTPAVTPAVVAQPTGRVYPVSHGRGWSVGSTQLSDRARRCLWADDPAVFSRAAWCFDDWRSDRSAPVTWGVVTALRPGADVTAVFGVTTDLVASLDARLSDGEQVRVDAARTPTDPHVRFFAFVVHGRDLRVRSIAPYASDGTLLAYPAVLQPTGGWQCQVGPDRLCGSPPA